MWITIAREFRIAGISWGKQGRVRNQHVKLGKAEKSQGNPREAEKRGGRGEEGPRKGANQKMRKLSKWEKDM